MKIRTSLICISVLFLLISGCTQHTQTINNHSYENISVVQLAKATQSWDNTTLPLYQTGQPEVTVLDITIPPHTALPVHMHPVINAGVMIEGSLTVKKENGETLYLKKGDTIVEVVDTWHYGMNEHDTSARIIVFYAGIEGEPITIKKE